MFHKASTIVLPRHTGLERHANVRFQHLQTCELLSEQYCNKQQYVYSAHAKKNMNDSVITRTGINRYLRTNQISIYSFPQKVSFTACCTVSKHMVLSEDALSPESMRKQDPRAIPSVPSSNPVQTRYRFTVNADYRPLVSQLYIYVYVFLC